MLHERCPETTRLYHVHLPKLDEAGIISFDVETKIAAVTADTGQ